MQAWCDEEKNLRWGGFIKNDVVDVGKRKEKTVNFQKTYHQRYIMQPQDELQVLSCMI